MKRFLARMDTILNVLGGNVRKLRERRKYSQERLAHLSALTTNFVSRVERGRQNISVLSLARIAKSLNVPLVRLFRGL